MKKSELIFSIIAVTALAFMLDYGCWKNRKINEDAVYVIGSITNTHDTENGWIYDFTYHYKNETFAGGVKTLIYCTDSVIFLKISRPEPKLWDFIDDTVPSCIKKAGFLFKSWDTIPTCN